jgi:hypothetical protein
MSQVNNSYSNAQGSTTYGSSASDLPDDPIADAAKAKMDAYLQAIGQGGIPQDAQDAIANFLRIFQDPQGDIKSQCDFWTGPPAGDNCWAGQKDDKDHAVASQIEFSAFMNENYPWTKLTWKGADGVNPLTASFFALCGLKTYDNSDSDSDYKTNVPSTSVFQSIINKLQGGMSQDDLKSTLGDLDNAEDQEKLVNKHYTVQPLLNFANKMVNLINTMESYCVQVGLGSGSDPCYNICRQWLATNPGDHRVDQPGYAGSWSLQDLAYHRRANTMNDFGISGSDFASQMADFLNEFNSLKP